MILSVRISGSETPVGIAQNNSQGAMFVIICCWGGGRQKVPKMSKILFAGAFGVVFRQALDMF